MVRYSAPELVAGSQHCAEQSGKHAQTCYGCQNITMPDLEGPLCEHQSWSIAAPELEEDQHQSNIMSRERGGGRSGGSNPVSLLVRNLSYRSGAFELKEQFGRYGDIRDVYIPLEYHSK